MAWHTVCEASEIAVGTLKAADVSGEKVLVAHLDDGFHAVQGRCTHVFAPLARGKLVEGCQVQCPLHRARFDLRSGEVIKWANFPPGVQLLNAVRKEKALKTFPVRVAKGKVEVEV
jgi:3-phenylpropionate/trans-cinnamate dioxygenase ferredoxin component